MIESSTKIGVAGATLAFLTSLCCVLPMTFMVLGLGGSWLVVFGQVSAFSLYIGLASVAALVWAWVVAILRKGSRPTMLVLSGGTILSLVAWGIFLNEAALNQALIRWM